VSVCSESLALCFFFATWMWMWMSFLSSLSLSLSLVSYMLRDTPTCISPTRRHELAFFLSALRGLA
jgi:hypothetical protein